MVMAKIKAGYKKTDIGVIPEDWDIKLVSDLCDIVSGGTPSTANPTFWIKGDIPWCIPSDITETSGKYLYKTDRNITSLGLSKSSANLLPEGSLLLCSRATIGEIKVAKTEITTNQGFKSLVCHSVDNEFMYYKVLTLKEQLLQLSTGSTFLEFSKKDISRLQIDVPKPKEQKAIAGALSDVDGLIESLEKLIAKKRNMKTATMQQLLTGKKRLSGFGDKRKEKKRKGLSTDEYKKTDIGFIPEDWDAPFMGDLAQIQRGASPRPIGSPIWFDNKSSVGWLRISDVSKSRKYLKETRQSLSGAGIANSRFVAEQNLVMSICATIGRPIITHKNLCIHDGFVVFDQLKADKEYMYYALSNIENDWAKYGQTGSQMNLNTGLINNTRIPLPSPKEQKAIATLLSDMDAEIESLEKRLEKVHNLKIGMMQELLTGKTRLIKADKFRRS